MLAIWVVCQTWNNTCSLSANLNTVELRNAPHLTLNTSRRPDCFTKEKQVFTREENLVSPLALLSQWRVYTNANCFIHYYSSLGKKRQLFTIKSHPLQLPWKQIEEGFATNILTSPPFFKKRGKWERASFHMYIFLIKKALHPVGLKLHLHSQHHVIWPYQPLYRLISAKESQKMSK